MYEKILTLFNIGVMIKTYKFYRSEELDEYY